jgi:tripartite-type tricarboxylate transporter receptor subunit TctC
VAEGLRVELGQPVLVENVAGAGGMLVAHVIESDAIF